MKSFLFIAPQIHKQQYVVFYWNGKHTGTESSDVSVSLQQLVRENDKQDQLCGISVREGSGGDWSRSVFSVHLRHHPGDVSESEAKLWEDPGSLMYVHLRSVLKGEAGLPCPLKTRKGILKAKNLSSHSLLQRSSPGFWDMVLGLWVQLSRFSPQCFGIVSSLLN